jgi:hypothetical protein
MTNIHPHAFRRAKGQKVIAEYIIIDVARLNEANYKHFPDVGETNFVPITAKMLETSTVFEDYIEVMRLCKTYIADPIVFELCRQIERRIVEVMRSRFAQWGEDRWLFEDEPLPLRGDNG